MQVQRGAVATLVGAAMAAAIAQPLWAGVINVPNGSFESPYVDMVSPYATSTINDWQKAPVPAWWLGLGYNAQQWSDSAGVFVNVPFAPIDNVYGRQAAFVFATPGVELFQDLTATFEVGQSYHLTVGIEGGGYGMLVGVPMEIRLYYRDGSGNRVTVGAAIATNANPTGVVTHLTDYQLDIPVVATGDAWAGKTIGVQLIQTVDLQEAGGFWVLDNVRLTPEPATLGLLALGIAGWSVRRRRRT